MDRLRQEHRNIERMLSVLEEMAARAEGGKPPRAEDAEDALDFARDYADKYHHAKEEDLLFKAMVEAGFPQEGGPIAVMLMEHDQGRGSVRAAAEGVAKARTGEKVGWAIFAGSALAFARLLRPHIDKEDNILYRMADAHLSEARQKELEAAFDGVEDRLGAVAARRLQDLDRLEKLYRGGCIAA